MVFFFLLGFNELQKVNNKRRSSKPFDGFLMAKSRGEWEGGGSPAGSLRHHAS
jgi:hypothetical protein